ncbi:beta-galactosidase [Caldibacillus lycopersici]|uniref:Beta-galactosidase n=1 Tax=Perspicuibacillus lycopersici TaxID=1325689 RepID=A0AAE3LSF2_9BACI|nr:beta-galactosidase [Perspicuibacillus lycopersici]MCU9612673.1 beta-galactosidase [Perspicuibacillus lycopersici]
MIEIKNKQILIDGKPQLIMCGEIHYYRLDREDWQDRIDKLKMAGCNAVASYVPWLLHEPTEGEIDLHGNTRPELDLEAFIDLCNENGLYFFLRPGPFIMAEMKNEGLPYWIYKKHPEIVPVGWDENPATTPTVDYLHPGYLQDVKKWYKAIMEMVAPKVYPKGNVIAVQLDNEIGMLSWVSNTPDLTDVTLEDFSKWLQEKYETAELQRRYPIDFDNKEARDKALRSPSEEYSLFLLKDLGYYMRYRFAKYVAELRKYSEAYGVGDIPFVINIHGTSAGRGFTFPIGISQLYESYTQEEGYLSGSDIYFGDLTVTDFQDYYIINGFMDAVHPPDQPLTSVEFNCGDGNFGDNLGGRIDPSAADFRTRMAIAQGNRLLNYYLFAGGRNYRFDELVHDGNDRIAITGEHHGFAAPVGPTGKLNYTFPRMARSIQTMMAVADKLAAMNEERDDVAFAFIPDYYMTEYRYPHSKKMREILANIEANRGAGAWESVGRALLLLGYRFTALDIQNKQFTKENAAVLVVPSAKYLDQTIQSKLVQYMNEGGTIILYGEVPQFDMEGNPCTILAEALGIEEMTERYDVDRYWLSVYTSGWVEARPEKRTHFAQALKAPNAYALIKVYGTGEVCGLDATVGNGRAIVLAAAYPCDLDFYRSIFKEIGLTAGLTHDCPEHGIFSTASVNSKGEKFIHLLNLDGFDKTFRIYSNGETLLDGKEFLLQSKDGVMLPINVQLKDCKVVYSTAEITKVSDSAIAFRLTQAEDVILLRTEKGVATSDDYRVEKQGVLTYIYSNKHGKVDSELVVCFN